MSFSPVFYSDYKKCNSIRWLLIASLISVSIYLVACEQALLGVGGGRGKEDPPPRELARRLSIWGNWRSWRLSLLKDCSLTHHTVKYGPSLSWKQLLFFLKKTFSFTAFAKVDLALAKVDLGRIPPPPSHNFIWV